MLRPRFPQTQADYEALAGGLDLVTPRIRLSPGRVFDAQNYEPLPVGGYRRINGYERYDGHTSPTSASYWALAAFITGTVSAGDTLTGATSGATGVVLGTSSYAGITYIVLGRVSGTYASGENLQVTAVTQAVASAASVESGAPTAVLDATWRLLAANNRRADIAAVPGSGAVRGVFVLADTVYAFRDNVGVTASILYKSTASGWQQVTFGHEMSFGALSSTVTITIASPGVVTWNNHGLANGQSVVLTTTGALPTGLSTGTTYYVVNRAANTFQLSATSGGSAINTSGTQSGTHTATLNSAVGIAVGDTVTGVTSSASAIAVAVLLRSGTWTSEPVGTIVFASVTGTFSSGETLRVSGNAQAKATSANAQIARSPGGRVEVVIGNFTGSSTTKKAYGADGTNVGFEFDGTTYVPIHTGQSTDTPTHVAVHKNKLFFAFASKVEYSTTNNPYAWTALTGAAEIGMGEAVTALLTQTGNQAGASLSIFTKGKTSILYGSNSVDFNLVDSVFALGYKEYTVQPVSNNTYGLTARGVQSLITTLNYGDFAFAALSFNVQPLLDGKFSLACSSVTLQSKNQYRLYFTDGSALVFGLTGEKLSGIMPLLYPDVVRCSWNSLWTTQEERTFFGSDDGWVFEENVGTSFDGEEIEAWIRPAFNNLRSPRVNKRYRRAVFEAECDGYAAVTLGYDLGYANPDVEPAAAQTAQSLVGAGQYWDSQTMRWEQFTWDAPVVTQPQISIDGSDNNIGFLCYSNSAMDDPVTWQGVSLLHTPRHLTR